MFYKKKKNDEKYNFLILSDVRLKRQVHIAKKEIKTSKRKASMPTSTKNDQGAGEN